MGLDRRPLAATTGTSAPHHRYTPLFQRAETDRGLLFQGEPPTCRREWRRFWPILAHLAILIAVAYRYRIEGRGFQLVLALAAAGLPIHYFVHYRWKRLLFVGLSMAGMGWVLGLDYAQFILPIGGAMIAACYLPIRWIARVAIVSTIGLAAGLGRAGWIAPSVPDGVWAILGSLFMFRMVLFLYELKHAERPPKILDSLSYFFLLPNHCFVLFPVIDFRTFVRDYYSADIHETQRDGLRLMTRGMVHLIAYRLIYHQLLVPPEAVQGPASLLAYLVCNYLLYVRVSGQFHIACGLLHLYGYKLPESHHNYLLANSFTDYWRRINIYWKDFMVRLVFNPVAFRLKRKSHAITLSLATVAVFVATWFLHAYQVFWRQGVWAFSITDGLFWGVLGLLVVVNVQLDARNHGRARLNRPNQPPTWRARTVLAAKTLATFLTIALLWSLWNSPTVGAWLSLIRRGLTA